ncbi:hypothetical protein PM3016_2272 [Paenibacillus mucilaginosus 3016]|uniref:Uncharacterized protein n=2 Tax=Paenibacillus mucilaginosus TaxID=61624 RepID=H6NHG5_9BACL|nr:hypothetical protein [Paenibacillus mucilaginosus]AFC29160.1 hypothetical protein PM3016_2272 [Paenibacillus mucilaginosus 3016]WFA17894.1 hypothetical protein ERY13_11720 [Paenibacillus mucilaginosus]
MKSNEFVGKVARMLVGLAKKETPATYVYILGAIFEFIPHLRKFGLKNATRIFKHNISKPWLEHLASDKYISEKQYHELYGKLLPNCKFQRMGWAMGIAWEKYK